MDTAARDELPPSQGEQLAHERAEKLRKCKAEWLRKRAEKAASASRDVPQDQAPTTSPPTTKPNPAEGPHESPRPSKHERLPEQTPVPASSDTAPAAPQARAEQRREDRIQPAVESRDDVQSDEDFSSPPLGASPKPGSGKRRKQRWSVERKLEAAEKRVSDAAAQAKRGSPAAVAKLKKLEDAAKLKAKKVEDAKMRKVEEAKNHSQIGSASSARNEPRMHKGKPDSVSAAGVRERGLRKEPPARARRPADEQTKGENVPQWRAQADKNLASLQDSGRINRGDTAPNRSMLAQLHKVHRELTATLLRWESASNGGGRVGMRRLQGGEENKWAFVDEQNVDDFRERVPDMVYDFPFELDPFQKRAILHVEQGNSVFVAAHTSAGKTVVAEYAIALAAKCGAKVFYTSPIKTLSNQKLRDFRGKFDDVGLVTGDVSINEDAQCVIMTTEILRSMLYRGADVIRDLMFVIFDEVQYLNDEERGVVWEESIIMLPPEVRIIMLSATVPNALEFASWVGKTKDRKVAVVSTSNRPVPLQHSWLHPKSGACDGLTEAVLLKQGGAFLHENYRAARNTTMSQKKGELRESKSRQSKRGRRDTNSQSAEEKEIEQPDRAQGAEASEEAGNEAGWSPKQDDPFAKPCSTVHEGTNVDIANGIMNPRDQQTAARKKKNAVLVARAAAPKGVNKNKGQAANGAVASVDCRDKGPNKKRSPWTPLVKFLHDGNRTPSVVFCFSKRKCEQAVESLKKTDLLPDAADKAYVHRFFEESIVKLREEDRSLPQVRRVRANLKRGISAHHAGLLPLIKEITEILFSKGLVKVLFATETFAMGINMPARTVVFSALRKHDGRHFRFLEAGEYTQMSGRAGRRGLDSVGHVFLFFPSDERIPEERQLCRMMTGKPISLKSAFRLTYNMILNVLRVDELRVEEMMKQSFSEAGEDMKAESITSVLDKAGSTLSRLCSSGSRCSQLSSLLPCEALSDSHESAVENNCQGCSEDSILRNYVQKFCELSDATARLTFRELNPIFERAVVPGRLVVAEVQPGLLSLAVVYAVVRQDVERQKVRLDSQIWVVALTGVVASRLERHRRSVLLIPEPRHNGQTSHLQAGHPRVCTSDGLVVTLREILAAKIVYICDKCDTMLSSSRAADQERVARNCYFARKRLQRAGRGQVAENWSFAMKTVHASGEYLQQVVSKWEKNGRKNNIAPTESFPAELLVSKGDRSSTKSIRRMKMHHLYDTRRQLCLEMVTDIELGKGIAVRAGNVVSTIERLVLEENIRQKMAKLKTVSETGSEPSLLPEYLKRIQVLQKLDYVDADGLGVKMKGRCACEVSTADSVVLTEIVLDNVLEGLAAAEVCSLLSSLVCRKKNTNAVHDSDAMIYSEKYRLAKAKMRKVVEHVGNVQEECGVELDFDIADAGDDYESAICRWDLAHAVYAWANGEPFCRITELTEQQEGDIVVCVKRLSELLKDTQSVAKGIGNDDLQAVLEEAVTCIRRDVIFNGSLYYEDATQ